MSLKEQVMAQAMLLAGELEQRQRALLEVLCEAAVMSLSQRLKGGFQPEDCRAAFVAAASLYALAGLADVTASGVEEFKAGDLTVRKGASADTASRCLQRQGDMIIGPYLKDSFCFTGV